MQPGRLNPYKIGIELFRDIEERWDRGQFGKAWLDCDDVARKRDWNTRAGKGICQLIPVLGRRTPTMDKVDPRLFRRN